MSIRQRNTSENLIVPRVGPGDPYVPVEHRHQESVHSVPDVVFHVNPHASTSGSRDENNVATLQEAVRAARARRAGSDATVTIKLAGGRHEMMSTLELTIEDSGTEACPFIIEGDPHQETVITGASRIEGFFPVSDAAIARRLPEESRARVWACDLKKNGIGKGWGKLSPRFGCGGEAVPHNQAWPEVYYNGVPLSLTRWPLEGYTRVGEVHKGERTKEHVGPYQTPGVFAVDESADLNKWQASIDSGDVWTSGMWAWLWNCSILPVVRVDVEERTLTHGLPAPMGIRSGKPFYFFNILEELSQPGQYYVDREGGMLYLIPPEGETEPGEAVVHLTIASQPFIRALQASHVILRNLTVEYNQADAVIVEGGDGVVLDRCRIGRLGGTAVIIQGGTNHCMVNCHLQLLGARGVVIKAGDRTTLTAGNCLIENCRIHDFARINRAYAAAVLLEGCGNRIRHCEIFNSPHHGVRVEGDNHLVELCSFHHLVLEFDDEAPLEMFGNPYYRGNRFRWNCFHHVGGGQTREGQAGIRLDDYISGVEIVGNLFHGVGSGTMGAIQLHGGKDTRVTGNLFIECQAMVSFSPWGEERWLNSLETWNLGETSNELTASRVAAYPDLLEVAANHDRNFIVGNVALGCSCPSLDDGGRNVWENNHVFPACPEWPRDAGGLPDVDFADPIFRGLDFTPIPVTDIGCYPRHGLAQGEPEACNNINREPTI